MGSRVDAERRVVREIAVTLRVLDELPEMQDAPVEITGLPPADLGGAFPMHPVLVETLGP